MRSAFRSVVMTVYAMMLWSAGCGTGDESATQTEQTQQAVTGGCNVDCPDGTTLTCPMTGTCSSDFIHTPHSITCNGVVTTCAPPLPPLCGDLGYACARNTLCCDYAGGFACRYPDPFHHQCPNPNGL